MEARVDPCSHHAPAFVPKEVDRDLSADFVGCSECVPAQGNQFDPRIVGFIPCQQTPVLEDDADDGVLSTGIVERCAFKFVCPRIAREDIGRQIDRRRSRP